MKNLALMTVLYDVMMIRDSALHFWAAMYFVSKLLQTLVDIDLHRNWQLDNNFLQTARVCQQIADFTVVLYIFESCCHSYHCCFCNFVILIAKDGRDCN